MTSRERVFTTLRHEEPDMVPFNIRVCPEIQQRLCKETGDPNTDWYAHFGHDIRPMNWFEFPPPPAGVLKEEWTPLPGETEQAAMAARIRQIKDSGVVVASGYQIGIFEHAKEWLGDVPTLTLPHDDPQRFEMILDRITEWKQQVYGIWVKLGVDVAFIGDDLGTQRSLIMSPAAYRTWYRPRHQRLIQHLRAINPNVKVAFHCCGHVTPLIRDLIEVGVDILEAVQAEAMDIAYLKREFGRDICFWGGVGAQSVLARATREQVIEGVRNTLAIMAPGGGYIAAPCHTMTEEVSWENILAFHDAIRQFRSYDVIRKLSAAIA